MNVSISLVLMFVVFEYFCPPSFLCIFRKLIEYKMRLFSMKIYFNRWQKIYEPMKIGNNYETKLMVCIQPFILQKNRS